MPRQTRDLKFVDRIAVVEGVGYLFRCQRRGHAEHAKTFGLKRDAEVYRTKHDAGAHTELGAKFQMQSDLTLGQALEDFQQRVEMLEAAGRRSPETTKFYKNISKRLLEFFGQKTPLFSITRHDCYEYIAAGRDRSGGARILQELEALEKVARDANVPLPWRASQFVDDIRPEAQEKPFYTAGEIAAFINHLPPDARDFGVAVLRTVMRNEELYALRVGDVDLESGVLTYIARSKGRMATRRRCVQYIQGDLLEIITRRISGRGGSDFVFTCEGRPAQQSSFRGACRRASEEAGVKPVIGGFKFLRHHVLTALRASIGEQGAADFAGHSTAVLNRFYDLDASKLAQKRLAAEAAAKAFPL